MWRSARGREEVVRVDPGRCPSGCGGTQRWQSFATTLGLSNRSSVIQSFSRRVVENDTERMTMSRANAADAVPQVDAIHAARALHRTMMDGEDNGVTLPKRHDFRPRLHARPLLGHHEFAAREVTFGFGQQDGDLERENVLAIEVLMQAVVIVRAVLKQQRRRA